MPYASLHSMLSLEATISAMMDEEGHLLPVVSRQGWWKKSQALSHWESYYLLQAVLRGDVPVIIEADVYKRIHYRLDHPKEGDHDRVESLLIQCHDSFPKNPWIRAIIAFCSIVFI
jgi:negative regulator of sigma E activity